MKRVFDFFLSLLGLLLISPIVFLICLFIKLESKGSFFYLQERIGQNEKPFRLFKFRTMYMNSDKKSLLTIGMNDYRITKIGYYLRKYKLDELPQLINILKGEMSFVGPRPEVKKYVDFYTNAQREVLKHKPGITDYASLKFFYENEILAQSENPEKTYITEIMPEKININLAYINSRKNLSNDIKVIFETVLKIIK
ncbi:sugar transferase [Emticicia sp. BO119]|uniref:sugar transferase n=1 Tax=Emticicia sp. BO119 TaxID=2757768 RepID=UPI0015EFE48E|nr:sugar transferase [Emticicia sp. BO119]MBA4853951.1 sugar transferase [Emticicia sp. BO119]